MSNGLMSNSKEQDNPESTVIMQVCGVLPNVSNRNTSSTYLRLNRWGKVGVDASS